MAADKLEAVKAAVENGDILSVRDVAAALIELGENTGVLAAPAAATPAPAAVPPPPAPVESGPASQGVPPDAAQQGGPIV